MIDSPINAGVIPLDVEKELHDLRVKVALLEASGSKAKWWNITGGIASILGSIVAFFTLVAVLIKIA